MGACRVDLQKKQRTLNEKYPLDSEEGVRNLILSYAELNESRFMQGLEIVNLLLDFESAMNIAALSESEGGAVSTAVNRGPSGWVGREFLDSAVKKITGVFIGWNYDDVTNG